MTNPIGEWLALAWPHACTHVCTSVASFEFVCRHHAVLRSKQQTSRTLQHLYVHALEDWLPHVAKFRFWAVYITVSHDQTCHQTSSHEVLALRFWAWKESVNCQDNGSCCKIDVPGLTADMLKKLQLGAAEASFGPIATLQLLKCWQPCLNLQFRCFLQSIVSHQMSAAYLITACIHSWGKLQALWVSWAAAMIDGDWKQWVCIHHLPTDNNINAVMSVDKGGMLVWCLTC